MMVNVGLGKVGYMESSDWLSWAVRGVQVGSFLKEDQREREGEGLLQGFYYL
jgi:hypothetical protein